jgi:hypothetical protein
MHDTPSSPTLHSCSTQNQRGNCVPMLAAVRLYSTLQLDVFIFCPATRTSTRQGDTGTTVNAAITASAMVVVAAAVLAIISSPTLIFRSTRNEHGYCAPSPNSNSSHCVFLLH